MPKLRKNRRIGTRWGLKYYTAVKNAVFLTQALPYVPREPPPTVKEYVPQCETLYMCAQCKDCFYFRSSLEDHIARKSWILGYWCQQCFVTVCRHSPTEGSLCTTCMQSNREKRLYLRSRGLRKRQKFGVVRIFYNQCQFFAHLKIHNVDLVDMGDLMLMPLPTNINHDWSPEVDIVCEAFMEHAFIMKVHIMDWLREKNIDKNWWQLAGVKEENTDNSVAVILKSYKGRFYFTPLEISIDEQFSTLNSLHSTSNNSSIYSDIEILDSVENVEKRTGSSIDTTTSISDESVIENEDSPCTVNDIAFVDCGPTTKYFEPKTPLNSDKNKCKIISVKSTKDSFTVLRSSKVNANKLKRNRRTHLNRISSNMVMSYGNTMITPKHNVKDFAKSSTDKRSWENVMHKSSKSTTPIKVVSESNTVKVESDKKLNKPVLNNLLIVEPLSKTQSDRSCVTKMDMCKTKLDKLKQNVHTLTVNSGQKIITFQSTNNVDIDTIINQLPPHIVNNKKIVFIGQDSDVRGVHSKQESPEALVHLVPDEKEKLSETKKNPENEKALARANKTTNKNASKNQAETVKNNTQSFTNKVVYQNGRKYIIKQSSGTTKHSKSVSNAVVPVRNVKRTVQSKSTSNIPPLIPLNPVDIENLSNQERMNSFHSDLSPLTPSPSPSELSSSSSCDVQSKQPSLLFKNSQKVDVSYLTGVHKNVGVNMQNTKSSFESLSFHKGEDENLYLDVKFLSQKPIYTIVDTSTMITKCQQEMVNEFFHLSYTELQKRYEHLQQIGEEILKVMNFLTDNVIRENLKAVNILQTVLKHCIDKCIEKSDDSNDSDAQLNEWESEYQRTDKKSICRACNKITKPKYYIPGFSKPAKNDNYCTCYKHVCHKCHTYQGNSTRFVSHQTFHDKEKPYLCPDCYRKFTTFKSLELHTWTTCFHTLKKRALGCKICEVDGFKDMESVARHFAIMHSHNKVACDKCYIVLPSYSEYKKHHKDKHPDSDDYRPIRLVLCKLGRCIVRCEEYMLHMEKHLVVQRLIWFKCPFCTFIHVEKKRIMSHLQTGHMARLKELISSEVLRNVLQVESATNLLNNAQQNNFSNADAKSCEDGTVMPKIINTRTITSEVFESGIQISDDYLVNYEAQQSPKFIKLTSDPLAESKKTLLKIRDVRSIARLTSNNSKCKTEQDKTARQMESSKEVTLEKYGIVGIESRDITESRIKVESDALSLDSLQQESIVKIKEEQDDSEDLKKEVLLNKEKIETEEVSADLLNRMQMQGQNEDVQCRSISKPPPLARIPRYESFGPNRSKKVAQPTKGGKTTVISRGQRTNRDLPQRIALNGPSNSHEIFNFSCNWCGELINTSESVISNHFRNKHSQDCKVLTVTADLVRMSPDFINGGYKDLLGSKKRKSDNIALSSKRRRRWNPKKYSDGKNASFTGVGLCVKQETAKDSEGNFRCKKCDQRCSDMADLREHIASNHRIRGRYLVCLECGDNFVVVPSLQMHLKAFHGIEDPITYMAQNTSYAPDNVDQLETVGKSIEANQCHVCMAVFEDKAAVDKHLRVHGMAFLNRKRIEAQNALKCPKKKGESEEEKRIPVKTYSKVPVRKDKPAETILEKITATI